MSNWIHNITEFVKYRDFVKERGVTLYTSFMPTYVSVRATLAKEDEDECVFFKGKERHCQYSLIEHGDDKCVLKNVAYDAVVALFKQ